MSPGARDASVPSITFTGSSEPIYSAQSLGHGTGIAGSTFDTTRSLSGNGTSLGATPVLSAGRGSSGSGHPTGGASTSGPHKATPCNNGRTPRASGSGSGSNGNAEIGPNDRTLPLALTALTSLEALNGAQMPSTFLPSYYPERNHHLLPSYARGSPREHSGDSHSRGGSNDGQGDTYHAGGSGSGSGNNSNNNTLHVNSTHRQTNSQTNSRSPNPHLLDGIPISEPLVQSPHGSPRLVLDEELPLSARLDTDTEQVGRDGDRDRQEGIAGQAGQAGPSRPQQQQQPFKPKDWGWAEIPLYGREDPTAMADIKAAGYLGDLYGPGTGPWANGKDVTAEEYAQALSIYEHLLSALPFISPRTSPTEQGLQSLIALAAEGMSIVAPAAPIPGNLSAVPLDRQRGVGESDDGGTTTVHPPVNKRGAKESKDSPVCLGCGATETPEWRRGPMGPRTLCNACGLVHMKMMRKKRKQEEAQAAKAQKKGERVDGNGA